MAKVTFKRIENSSDIDNVDIEDGAFIVTGDGRSYIDYNGKRVSTNGTPDIQMSDTSTNSVQNKTIKEYIDNSFKDFKETVKPDVLYYNETGSSASTINLTGNTSKYKYIEILYKRSNETHGGSVKIDLSSTFKATLTSTYYTSGTFYIDCKNIQINDTTIGVNGNNVMYSSGGSVTISNVNNIAIYEVLGYE